MNRRAFLRSLAVVPAVPMALLAGPTPVGAVDIRTKRFLFRVSEFTSSRERAALGAHLRKWEAEGQKHSLILPDTVEVYRLEE